MGARRTVGRNARACVAWLGLLSCMCVRGVELAPCLDPTNDGSCFCPVGASCEHQCGPAVGHCTLGCSQGNGQCAVTCATDCVALCEGAGRCEAHCGERCNVSCGHVREHCIADVGPNSTVDCTGGNDCQVSCQGACTVACPAGRCRVRCAHERECDLDCGAPGVGLENAPRGGLLSCPDGSQVCGQPC
jgi:hypothetical protein